MLSSRNFLSLPKIIHLNFSSPKWIDISLSTNQSHILPNSLFKTFLISVTSVYWWRVIASSIYRYFWVFDRASKMSFIYNKNNRGPNIDLWETQQFIVRASKKRVPVETKKVLIGRKERNNLLFDLKKSMHYMLSNKILWSKMSKTFWRVKSHQYIFHFQYRLKPCWLIETNMYLWNDLF